MALYYNNTTYSGEIWFTNDPLGHDGYVEWTTSSAGNSPSKNRKVFTMGAAIGKIITLPEDCSYMFDGATSFDKIWLFDTSNVTNMSYMFREYQSTSSLDLSSWDVSNVTNMSNMFLRCNLTSLNLSGWNTSNVTNMGAMFYSCTRLASLDLSGFDTSKVTDMHGMFCYCSNLTSLSLSGWDTRNVMNMSSMFYSCSNLTSLDLYSFKPYSLTDMGSMFFDCSALKSIVVSNSWTIAPVLSGSTVFNGCTSLIGGAGTTFDSSHTTYNYAIIDTNSSGTWGVDKGYLTGPGWYECELYLKTSEGWVKQEVYA